MMKGGMMGSQAMVEMMKYILTLFEYSSCCRSISMTRTFSSNWLMCDLGVDRDDHDGDCDDDGDYDCDYDHDDCDDHEDCDYDGDCIIIGRESRSVSMGFDENIMF